MVARKADAEWEGDLRSGKGRMSLGSGAFSGSYSFPSRFESGEGTNPEELVAAAHAACYSMALSNGLAKAGFTPTSVETSAAVQFGPVEGGFAITRIDLTTRGDVPGIDAADFEKYALEAKAGCPISKALAAVEITLDAQLV